MSQIEECPSTTLPDGRNIHCVNAYEVGFGWHEIVSDDLTRHGLSLPADGVYFDVGANIGLFCLRLRDLCPEARIFAFEPMPGAFEALRRNAASMGGPVEVHQMALGAAPGQLEFDYFPGLSALSNGEPETGGRLAEGLRNLLFGEGASEEIRAIIDRSGAHERLDDEAFIDRLFRKEAVTAEVDTLERVVARHGIDTIDLLKIDTEGQERAVLDGISPALWPRIRQLLVEVHRGEEELHGMRAELEERGYRTVVDDHPMAQGGAPVFHIYAHRPQDFQHV
ncbi:FkbM family methyltransferase [Alkalilimnicola sp. S0819]|uniref:FkbM family methyltransferase n=1 Tax=Alkalilimnicola sp. S0819 TaxID=2613922 RepID=UPI00126262D9|nr:FkbM family methyltransferase [Alkalilimnicola sp. S0819]KAB7619606.1 FkbM family methyltransferase [Alkalilimnicola sp. S0819]MPQ17610.1 FkbM family methyltransferase [Alkalilimnicola sp. S0819]